MPASIRGVISPGGGYSEILSGNGGLRRERERRGGEREMFGAQTYLLRQMINADDEGDVAVPGFSPAVSLPALLFLVVFGFVILADSNGV